ALTNMIGRPVDANAVIEKAAIGFAELGVAGDLEGNVKQADLAALGHRRLLRLGMLEDVQGMEVLPEGHESATVVRVFLAEVEPEDVLIEALRSLLIGDPQCDVSDFRDLHTWPPSSDAET